MLALDPELSVHSYFIAGPAVAIAAFFAGPGPAILAAVGYHAVELLQMSAFRSFSLANRQEAIRVALSLISCSLIIVVIEAMRRQGAGEEVGEILESISDCFYTLDRNWKFTFVNSQATRYFNRRKEELLGQNFWQLMPQKAGTIFEHSFETTARTGQPVQFEAISPVTNRWLDVHAYPAKNGISVFFRDTTDVSRARIGENRLRAILNSATDAIITIDEQEHITLFSRGAEQIFHCTSDEASHQPIEKFIPERFRGEHHNYIRRFGETGVSVRQMGGERVLRALRADGEEFPMEAQISQSEVAGEKLFTVIVRDVSERVRLEEEREKLIREAREAADVAARASQIKDDFLAMVSHELRNPLTPILFAAKMLSTATLDEVVVRKSAERIERAALSQAQLIEDLLDVSRITAGKLRLDVQRVDLPEVIRNAVESLKAAAESKAIVLKLIADPRGGFVSGDKERLQQVIWNLLSNAIKFTGKGGKVDVTVQRINSHVEIIVRDTGCGIASEFLPYVFERFRQAEMGTARGHSGLGLGLAIVRHLVELHGGTVSVDSAGEGKGATFTVALPVAPIQPAPSPDRVHPTASEELQFARASGLSLEGIRVVVVDDDSGTLEALAQTLTAAGALVRTCSSAREGLAAIRSWRPALLVCDIGMPEEDGYSLIKKIQALPPEDGGSVPALALTAYARVEDRMKVLSSGFQMHVPKPVQPDELITVIRSLSARIPN